MKRTQRGWNSTIRTVSKRQAEKLKLWDKITRDRTAYLTDKYGKPICEYCGKSGYEYDNESPFYLRGHHIDKDRKNNTPENCYVCHNAPCHQYITDNHVVVWQEDFWKRKGFI